MSKEQLIGKEFNLDLGSLAPVSMIVKDVTKDKVIVEYLNSTPGRTEEFTISDFEYFAMIKIESYELSKEEIPTIDLKLETKEVKGRVVYTPWMVIETPYVIFSDKDGTRKIWTKNKWKIVLYYLYRVTRIEWFIKKYNKIPR
jgi:hypothetical protein